MDNEDSSYPALRAELLGRSDQLRLPFDALTFDPPTPELLLDKPSTITSSHALDLTDRRGRSYVLTVHQDRLSRFVLSYRLHLRGDT